MAARARLLVGISILWVPLAFLFDGVTVLVLPLRVGGDAAQLGLISLFGLGIAAVLQPVAGWLSDRVRDRLERRVFVALAAVPAALGLWFLVGTTGLLAAVAGYAVLQLGATGMQAAQQALIPERVEGTERGRAAGLKAAFDVGGAFVAFLVLGAILASDGPGTAAIAITVLLVASIALTWILVPPGSRAAPNVRWSFDMPPGFPSLIVSRFLFLFATFAVGRFLVLLIAERMGVAAERAVDEAGWLLATFTLTTAIAAVPLGWLADRVSRRHLMDAGSLLAAAGIAVLVLPAGLLGVLVGGLVMSVGTALFVTANWAATTAIVPAAEAGRLMAMANLGTGLAAAAAGAVGPLIDAYGFAPALLVAAVASAAAVVPVVGFASAHHATRETVT